MISNPLATLSLVAGGIALAALLWVLPRIWERPFVHGPGGVLGAKRRANHVSLGVMLVAAAAASLVALDAGIKAVIAILAILAVGLPVGIAALAFHEITGRRSRSRQTYVPLGPEQKEKFRAERVAQREDEWRKQLDELPFPWELVSGDEAETAYLAARERGREDGHSAVILAPGCGLPVTTREKWREPTQQELQAIPPAQELLDAYQGRMLEDHFLDPGNPRPDIFDDIAEIEPPAVTAESMGTVRDILQNPPGSYFAAVAIVRIPTPRSWEIPVYLRYGGWNGSPDWPEMASIARRWHDQFGADVCAIGDGTLEFRVERPPLDHHAATNLLREQLLFCPDTLGHISVPRDLEPLAASLRLANYWQFWWD
jgi:hypothetical protein